MGTYITLLTAARNRRKEGLTIEQAMAGARRSFALTGLVVERDPEGNAVNPVENPTGQQLQQALKDYMPLLKQYAQDYVSPEFTPEEMEQRYTYSKKCMTVLEKLVEEHIQRDTVFKDTAKRLFGEYVGSRVDQRRWIEQLMHLDNTPEAERHNEEVVALAMLGEAYGKRDGPAGEERFRQARRERCAKDHPEWDAARINAEVNRELSGAMNRLMDLTESAMRNNPSLAEADVARDAILSGTAETSYPGGLEGAYRKLINPGSTISWNISNTCDDFRYFGAELTKEEQKRRFRPYEMNSCSTHGNVVEHVANPFYAVLDAAGLVNSGAVGLPKHNGEADFFNAAQSFGEDTVNGLLASCNDIKWRVLPRFALTSSDSKGVRGMANEIGIYSNGNGRTVIIVSDPLSLDNGLRADPHTDMPGRLLNATGYSQKITDFLQESTRNDRFMHSSGKYRDLKRALRAMPREIPDNLSVEEARKLERCLTNLNKAADAYIQRKNDQYEERGADIEGRDPYTGKDPYEQARYAFGKSVQEYAGEIKKHVKLIREHTETMANVLAAERREKKAQISAGKVIDSVMAEAKAGNHAMNEENNLIRNDGMDEAAEELIGDHAITEAEQHLKSNAQEEAKLREVRPLDVYILEAQQAYADALMDGDAREIKSCAATLLAAKAVEEFIRYGEKVDAEMARRFKAAADSGRVENLNAKEKDIVVVDGKVQKLVDGIKMTPKFEELLDGAAPDDPNTFGEKITTTAAAVGRNAVLCVQAAMKLRNGANKGVGGEPIGPNNIKPVKANDLGKAGPGGPAGQEPPKKQKPPKVKGGPSI